MTKKKSLLTEGCLQYIVGVKDVQDVMSGKWKYRIVAALYYTEKMRFMELKNHISGIAPKVLSSELKDLEMNHLVKRTVCDTKPITVEYELTELGKSLNGIIEAMGVWGIKYRKSVLKK
ncbi:helix-turn-helix domain-containing protein [Chitinophagaceae bacterium 26-R-25]|nr:helix-turn-helix domain-containing protein [Chitinophagaceae bacterium 26-R-25]